MKDTIKLHEICGYLPYGLKVLRPDGRTILPVEGIANGLYIFTENGMPENTYGDLAGSKSLLRPLSDLTKEIEHNGKRFVPIVKLLQEYCFDTNEMTEQEINEYAESMIEIDMSYMVAQMLMEWQFDIHGLIDRNLALNLNDYEI